MEKKNKLINSITVAGILLSVSAINTSSDATSSELKSSSDKASVENYLEELELMKRFNKKSQTQTASTVCEDGGVCSV